MFLKAGAVSLALLLLSRLLGLARESAQAAAFGASGLADAAVLMLTLPDWLAGMLASGALAYVLLPHWAHELPVQQAATQRRVARALLLTGVALAVALWLARAPVLAALAPGLPQVLQSGAADALGWSALAVPMALLAALWATRLQHERDFTGLYGANLVVNGTLVITILIVANYHYSAWAMTRLGLGLLVAFGLRLVWLRWRLTWHAAGVKAGASPTGGGAATDRFPHASLWWWAALSAGLPLALPFAARSMASQSGEGALAIFNYAWKLVELPLVLAIQLVATLAFPVVTRAFAGESAPADAVRRAFALAWTLACAAAGGLLVGAPAVARLLFGWGRMGPDGLALVAAWGRVAAWGLLPQALIAVALTVLAVQGRMRAVVLAYAAALAALLALGGRDGAQLMAGLNVALSGVAVVSLVALGREVPRWLPWRSGLAPLAVLLVLAGLMRVDGFPLQSFGTVAGLLAAGMAAIAVVAVGWITGPDLRSALRR
ncbi:MAG: lipid II flippase MurJ [Burkholderiaceae bacterium]|nr:lipid II flippase MurJ [Burkholderiaceae bacterium]MDZ4143306.1 lipid II flippase MurJ [Burkholderiales bacterium]